MTSSQAIIFDLDDTLYPEQSFVFSGYNAVAELASQRWGIDQSSTVNELTSLFESGNRNNTLGVWLERHQFDKVDLQLLIDTYRNHSPDIAPFEGIRDLLAELSVDNRLGLISDGYLQTQQRKFAALALENFFASVVFSDQWGREFWKPSERPYRHCLTALGSAPHQAVYVGDNPKKDFVTANSLGMRTIRLRTSTGIYADLEPPSPAHAPHINVFSTSELRLALLADPPHN